MESIDWVNEKSRFVDWNLIKQSYRDLHRIHEPKNLDKFTDWFINKYRLSKDLKEKLMNLV